VTGYRKDHDGHKGQKESLLWPIVMPVGLLATILIATVSFSRILLSENSPAATTTALLAAAAVVAFGVFAATRKRLEGGAVAGMIVGIVGVTMMFGGSILLISGGPEKEGPTEKALIVNITAPAGASTKGFEQKQITVPAGEPLKIAFANQEGGVQHNVQIFDGPDAKAPSLMDGAVITGPASSSYDVDPLKAGTYAFICKIHPTTMTGVIIASDSAKADSYNTAAATSPGPSSASGSPAMSMSPSAAAPKPPAAASPASTEPAKATAKPVTLKLSAPTGSVASGFSSTSLTAPAGAPITIDFDNQDGGVTHNVEIFTADPLMDPSATQVFSGEKITGPDKVSYDVGPLEAAAYFYRCVVHPTTMTGTLTVK